VKPPHHQISDTGYIGMLLRPREYDHRTPVELREHYEIEKELASRLRTATGEQRRSMYRALYDELYHLVPHHPQVTRKSSVDLTHEAVVPQIRLLRQFVQPESTVLEIGPGDCALSVQLAQQARQVYGLDVSEEITYRSSLPSNFKLILSDGTSVPLPPGSVDVAYSNQLMEHLHPDDALDQLQGIWRALRPGGVYICITPSRLNGPHDISRFFDLVATGFHLKEYIVGELNRMFRKVGFRKVHSLFGRKGVFIPMPVAPVLALEATLHLLPAKARRLLALTLPCRALLGVRLVATK
jgi:SAM-dependent methyltransferase